VFDLLPNLDGEKSPFLSGKRVGKAIEKYPGTFSETGASVCTLVCIGLLRDIPG
jgi:hypothetical protein